MSQNPDVAVLPVPGPPGDTVPEHRVGRLILKNSATVVGVTFAQKLLGLLLFRALALHYGPATFGDWNTAFAFLSFFGIITDAGIDTIVVREVARKRSDLARFIGTAILAKVALAGIAYSACIIMVVMMPYRLDLKLLILLAAVPMFGTFNSIYADVLQAEMKIGYIKTVGLFISVLTTLGGFLVIWAQGDLFALATVNIVVAIPALLMYQRMARRVIHPSFVYDQAVFRALLKEALPLAFSVAFGVIYYRVDAVLLSLFKTSDSVGYYAATYKLTEALNVLPGAVLISVFPLLSRYAQDPACRAQMERLYHTVFKYMLMLVLPIAVGVTVLAEPIILLVYSPDYLAAIPALRFIIWAEVPMFVSPIVFHLAIAQGRQVLLTRAALVMAVFNILTNLLLIPFLSFTGSALATSLTELIGLVLGLWFVYRAFHMGLSRSLWPVFASLIPYTMFLLLVPITRNFVFAPLAALVYLIGLQVTGAFRFAELRVLLTRT